MKDRLEDPEFIKKLKYAFYATLATFVILGFFIQPHPYYWWEEIPGFYAIYGFISCILIIIGAKALGHRLIQREEDYYD